MITPPIKILDRLDIKSCWMITHQNQLWQGQSLYHINKTKEEKENEIIEEMLSNRKPYVFHPLAIELHYYLCISGGRVGARYSAGRGRKGYSFPEVAASLHRTREGAEQALSLLKLYFTDLAEKSVWGERTKRAGEVMKNWHLFE